MRLRAVLSRCCWAQSIGLTVAPQISKEEGVLDFREPALTLHNKARTHGLGVCELLVHLPSACRLTSCPAD
jgi:hypothetical protein